LLSYKSNISYTRIILKEFFENIIKIPLKITATAAANEKGKKNPREDVETSQSAPHKQVQKKVSIIILL